MFEGRKFIRFDGFVEAGPLSHDLARFESDTGGISAIAEAHDNWPSLGESDSFFDYSAEVGQLPAEMHDTAKMVAMVGKMWQQREVIREGLDETQTGDTPTDNYRQRLEFLTAAPLVLDSDGTSLVKLVESIDEYDKPTPDQLTTALSFMIKGTAFLEVDGKKPVRAKQLISQSTHALTKQYPLMTSMGLHYMFVTGSSILGMSPERSQKLREEVNLNKYLAKDARSAIQTGLEVMEKVEGWRDDLLKQVCSGDLVANEEMLEQLAIYLEDDELRPFVHELLGVYEKGGIKSLYSRLEAAPDSRLMARIKHVIGQDARILYGVTSIKDIETRSMVSSDGVINPNQDAIKDSSLSLHRTMGILKRNEIVEQAPDIIREILNVDTVRLVFRDGKSTKPLVTFEIQNDDGTKNSVTICIDTRNISNSSWDLLESINGQQHDAARSVLLSAAMKTIEYFGNSLEPESMRLLSDRLASKNARRRVVASKPETTTVQEVEISDEGDEDSAPAEPQDIDTDFVDVDEPDSDPGDFHGIRDYCRNSPLSNREAAEMWFKEEFPSRVELIVDELWHFCDGATRMQLVGVGYAFIHVGFFKSAAENGLAGGQSAGAKIDFPDIVRLVILKDMPELFEVKSWKKQVNNAIDKAINKIAQDRESEKKSY